MTLKLRWRQVGAGLDGGVGKARWFEGLREVGVGRNFGGAANRQHLPAAVLQAEWQR